jgi:predicted transcriptional regulator
MAGSVPISTLMRINSTTKDLLIQLYDLAPLDMDLIIILIKNKVPMTLEELTREGNRDKSTVFRSLQKLVSMGICNKEIRTLKEGGLYHVYSIIALNIFKKETEKKVMELEESIRKVLGRFEKDLAKMVADFYDTNKKL